MLVIDQLKVIRNSDFSFLRWLGFTNAPISMPVIPLRQYSLSSFPFSSQLNTIAFIGLVFLFQLMIKILSIRQKNNFLFLIIKCSRLEINYNKRATLL